MSEPATFERVPGPVASPVGPAGTDPASDGLDGAPDEVPGHLRAEAAGPALLDPSRRFLITTAARGRDAGLWHGGDVHPHLALEPGHVVAMVRDTGRRRERRGQHRGHGTTLLAEPADEVRVDRSGSGTQVLIRRTLPRSEP